MSVRAIEIVSAEIFHALGLAHSSYGLFSRIGDAVPKVRDITYGGKRFTVLSERWWSNSRCSVDAYELVPVEQFTGTTVAFPFDTQSFSPYTLLPDLSGLVVEVDGVRMVCARKHTFERGLPAGSPMCFREAMVYSEAQRKLGWRSKYQSKSPQVFSLNGHPVFKYQNAHTGEAESVLLWKMDRQVCEIRLDRSTKLEGVPGPALLACVAIPA